MSATSRPGRFRAIRNAPADAILDVVRPYVAGDDWDRPHHLLVICWDGEKAWLDQDSQAPLTMNPDRIDKFIMARSQKAFERHKAAAEQGAAPTLYAVAFVMEGHAVAEPGPDASEWERTRFQRDRRERRYHEREDAVEVRTAWTADIDGRLHHLEVRADRPGMSSRTIDADADDIRATGRVIRWARVSAMAIGVLLHGDTLPTPGRQPLAAERSDNVVPLTAQAGRRSSEGDRT